MGQSYEALASTVRMEPLLDPSQRTEAGESRGLRQRPTPGPVASVWKKRNRRDILRKAAEQGRQVQVRKTEAPSDMFKMLSPYSRTWQARLYRSVMGALIVLNVASYLLSTDKEVYDQYGHLCDSIEGSTACLFFVDYAIRLYTVVESKKWRAYGPLWSRFYWMISFEGLVDALATFPFFLDETFLHNVLPSTTWVRVFRIFIIFRANRYAHALNTVARVLTVNAEILTVTLVLVLMMLLTTATLLWAVAKPEIAEINGLTSVP